jgi:hypothetical protein
LRESTPCILSEVLKQCSPQIFSAIGAGDSNLLITGFFGIVKIFGCLVFLLFLVDVVGRKKPFMGGAFAMGSFMLIIAIIVLKFPPKADADGITPAGAAAIAIVYCEAIAFNMSWGPLPWLCESPLYHPADTSGDRPVHLKEGRG